MFGASAFGAEPLASSPVARRLIFGSAGEMATAADVDGKFVALAWTSSSLHQRTDIDGGLLAGIAATAALTNSVACDVQGTTVQHASGFANNAARLEGDGGGGIFSSGAATGSLQCVGYRMWAYDQAFPANPTSGYIVQIGPRLFEWRVASARWHPAGPAS